MSALHSRLCMLSMFWAALLCGACGDEPSQDVQLLESGSVVVVPARIEAETYVDAYDVNPQNKGGGPKCDRGDAVDIQATRDVDGECNIGWTRDGEWLEYALRVENPAVFRATFRIAASWEGRRIQVLVDGEPWGHSQENPQFEAGILEAAPALGYHEYVDVKLTGALAPGEHTLRVVFQNGGINFNYFVIEERSVEPLVIPGLVRAGQYVDFSETDFKHRGEGYNEDCVRGDGVDLETTLLDPNRCHVAWTEAGESLTYLIEVEEAECFEVAVRGSSDRPNRHIELLVDGEAWGESTEVSPAGWQSFFTSTFRATLPEGRHLLTVRFKEGKANFSSLGFERVDSCCSPVVSHLLSSKRRLGSFDADIASNGHAIVSFTNGDGAPSVLTTIHSPESGWGETTVLNQPGLDASWVESDIDAEGRALSLWFEYKRIGGRYPPNYFRYRTYDPEEGWSDTVGEFYEDTYLHSLTNFELTMNDAGEAVGSWQTLEDSFVSYLGYRRFSFQEGWTYPGGKYNGLGGSVSLASTMDAEGTATVVFTAQDSEELSDEPIKIFARRGPSGQPWEDSVEIAEDVGAVGVALDQSGEAIVIYRVDSENMAARYEEGEGYVSFPYSEVEFPEDPATPDSPDPDVNWSRVAHDQAGERFILLMRPSFTFSLSEVGPWESVYAVMNNPECPAAP